jgi:hypothetical protein
MSGLLMAPTCGVLVVLRQTGGADYISGCWEKPGHEGPHVIILPPEPHPQETELSDFTEAVETVRTALEQLRGWYQYDVTTDAEETEAHARADVNDASLDTLVARIAELEGERDAKLRGTCPTCGRVSGQWVTRADNDRIRAALEQVQADMDSILQLAESLSPEKEK